MKPYQLSLAGIALLFLSASFRIESGFQNNFSKKSAKIENKASLPNDQDEDGVEDEDDRCPDTPAGVPVDAFGCPIFGD